MRCSRILSLTRAGDAPLWRARVRLPDASEAEAEIRFQAGRLAFKVAGAEYLCGHSAPEGRVPDWSELEPGVLAALTCVRSARRFERVRFDASAA